MKVKSVMTKKPIYVELPCHRDDVVKTLVKHNKTALPVVNREGKVVGVITRHDLFAHPREDQVSLIMKRDSPVVSSSDDIKKAAQLMLENDVWLLPVVDNEKLVGVITPTDLLRVVVDRETEDPVEKYVRKPCVPVYEGAPIKVAITTMKLTRIYALPVLNDDARLSGIITDRDIFALTTVNGSVAISDLGLGEDEDSWTWEGLRNVMKLYYELSEITLPDKKVKEVMVKNPVSIFGKSTVAEAANIMLKNDFGQLPIRNSEDRLEAMIYDLDLLAALL